MQSETDDTLRDPLEDLRYPDDVFGMDPVRAYGWGFASAMGLVREHDAARPSGDEALRAAAERLLDVWPMQKARETARLDLVAALATPSSAPDSCPCGHDDDEHVHYCSHDDTSICPCNAEYVRS
jgi:hypothetical protein